jgi:thiol-disulfide isomerase/thioredoxin
MSIGTIAMKVLKLKLFGMKGSQRQANLCYDLLNKCINKAAFILCLVFATGSNAFAQTAKIEVPITSLSDLEYDIQPLTIGDKAPDITFHNVLNYKSKTAKLSDFSGKLIILDMWSVYCTSCIAGFPMMEKLQNEFGKKIQIILVNPHDAKYDSEEKIKATLENLKTRTGFYPSLPVPIHDSILNRYFPHQSVPHTVWLDANKNVIAITGSLDVTTENIKKVLEGKSLDLAIKDDWAFDNSRPLLVDGNGGGSNDFIFRSLFTKYKSGIGNSSGVRLDDNKKVIGIYSLNKILRQFINESFSDIINNVNDNRVVIESDNPGKFRLDFDTANTYCYDLTVAPVERKSLDIKQFIQEDLRRFFNISVNREKRKINCYVISQTYDLSNSYTKFQKSDMDIDASSLKKYIRNYPVSDVINFLDRFQMPMVNEVNIEKHIDIEFPTNANLSDVNTVLKVLRAAGFNIREEERIIEVVVISDKSK